MVRAVAFSPNGALIASASDDNTVWLWNVAVRPSLGIVEGHATMFRSIVFSSDGNLVASISESDNVTWIWNSATGKAHSKLQRELNTDRTDGLDQAGDSDVASITSNTTIATERISI
jgi:WD40 repeat protein